MTEGWGVPDWLRPQDYPRPPEKTAPIVWAWEFLRRNEAYRNFWPGRVEEAFDPSVREMFGIDLPPPDPRQNRRTPIFRDLGTKVAFAPASTDEVQRRWRARGESSLFLNVKLKEKETLTLSWYEMGFAINLNLPLDDQIKAIRLIARDAQRVLKDAGLADPRTTRTSSQYVLYLRILDAEAAGATRPAIAAKLFSKRAQAADVELQLKAFDNARAEARRLRDSGYRALACRAKGRWADSVNP
jgi:hypothetical protein